jgi:integrase
MSVYKLYKGKRVDSRNKDYDKGTWYFWKRVNGRAVQKALKDCKTKDQAEAAARKIEEKIFNQRYGLTDTVTTFSSFADEVYTPFVKKHNVNVVGKLHYIALLKNFFKDQVLTTITPNDCRLCQAKMEKTASSASSVNRIMSTLSKMFTIACQESIIDRNPMQYVVKLREPMPRNRLLSESEWESLWAELNQDMLMKRLITLAVNLPLRRGQLFAITPEAIDFERDIVWVIGSKRRAARFVPLNFTASETLRAMIADGQLPFPLKDIRKRWSRITIAAKINKRGGTRGENYTFHDLRKEFATRLVKNNVNPELIRQLFAHSDLGITQIYMHPEMRDLHTAINSLNPESATDLQHGENKTGLPN